MPITLPYTTVADVVAEAKLAKNLGVTFTTADVERMINEAISQVNQYTSKTIADPWTTSDTDTFPIIQRATMLYAASYLLGMFLNKQDEAAKKLKDATDTLNQIVYGEGGDPSGPKGDIVQSAGSYEIAEFENLINEDVNLNLTVGS